MILQETQEKVNSLIKTKRKQSATIIVTATIQS